MTIVEKKSSNFLNFPPKFKIQIPATRPNNNLIEYVSKMNDKWIQRQKVEKERQEAETKAQNAAKYKKLYELMRACAKETPNESQYGDPQYQSTEIWSPQPSSSGHRRKHTVRKEKNTK